jgi:tetratricopeptide (TPR) repeat protein/anti-sigma regulatory factor (Ser/Thr protein kinase)
MSPAEWFRPPRHLLVMFFGITMVSAAALGWLSWQLVLQDREIARQQAQEDKATAGRLVQTALQKNLSELEERLTSLANLHEADVPQAAGELSAGLPPDSVLVIFHSRGVEAYPSNQLLYYPALPGTKKAGANVFAEADLLEARQKDFPGAIALVKPLTQSPDPVIRAEAFQRLGRNLRLAGRREEAAAAYDQLIRMDDVSTPPGIPAGLAGRVALISMFENDDNERALQEARALHKDLHSGRWRLEGSVYRAYADQLKELLGDASPEGVPSADAVVAAEAVEDLWTEWQGRQSYQVEGRSVFLVSRRSTARTVALVAGPKYVETLWLSELEPDLKGYSLALGNREEAANNPPFLGPETGLPWNIYASSSPGSPASDTFSRRSQLVIAGVGAIALLVLGGSYLIGRAVARELAVARQQSDFVSAVSHEFRTPLTALRQLSELLVQDRVPDNGVRHQYYHVLQSESARLHRLVEGLLKFGRMEAGAAKYQFTAIDATAFLKSLVEEFGREADRQGSRVELSMEQEVPPARADREALSCVVWNLLDNAVKYSPECRTVWVDLARENGHVAIRVRDKGVGIPREEHERIFQKFVRGETAKSLAVPGTGIGLAVAQQIIRRHGGEIRLNSEPGAGSTFTVLLPVAES